MRILLALVTLVSSPGFAQPPAYPRASLAILELEVELKSAVAEIQKMGSICNGGARKWSKVYQLKRRYVESEPFQALEARADALPLACKQVADSNDQFDPRANELVIPQRIHRASQMTPEVRLKCLQFWADWFAIDKISDDLVRPTVNEFQGKCNPPPETTGDAVPDAELESAPANR